MPTDCPVVFLRPLTRAAFFSLAGVYVVTRFETGSANETGVLADRIGGLAGEGAFEIAAATRRLAAAGRDVVQLAIGEPDFAPPPRVIEAAVRALHDRDVRYGAPEGLAELRQAIAASLSTIGLTAAADQIVVTPGGKPALAFAVLSLVRPGDAVLVPDPGFPVYASLVRFAGGTPVPYAVSPSGEPLPDDISLARLSPRARVAIINSPHNPTGTVASRAGLERFAAAALRHDLTVISDEVYGRLVYDDVAESTRTLGTATPVRASSIASVPGLAERTVVVDSFSKTYAMTGFRLGYGVFPERLVRAATLLAVNVHSCVPAFVQRAGLAALGEPEETLHARRAELRRRRDAAVDALRAIGGIECAEPRGAFYVYPRLSGLQDLGVTTATFCASLLHQHGVALLPGTAFGASDDGAVRVALTTPADRLREAIARLDAHVAELGESEGVPARRSRATSRVGGAA